MISTKKAIKTFSKYLNEYAVNGKIDKASLSVVKYDLSKRKQSIAKKSPHKTVELEYDDEIIDIDKNISDLMECLWVCDIQTVNSCENNIPKNYIWIEFLDFFDLERFQDILFTGMDNYDERKIRALDTPYYRTNAWKWDMAFGTKVQMDRDKMIELNILTDYYTKLYKAIGERAFDDLDESDNCDAQHSNGDNIMCSHCHCCADTDEELEEGKIEMTLSCFSVRFPQSDYKWILKKFQSYIVKHDFRVPKNPHATNDSESDSQGDSESDSEDSSSSE